MKTWMIVVAVILVVIIVGIAAVFMIGSNLPVAHTITRSLRLKQPPQAIYAAVRDLGSYSEWRPDVKNVEVTTSPEGRVTFREDGSIGAINFEVAEDVPGKRLVTRITDTDLGFGGMWTYEFTPDADGTLVTITENGEVTNVFFRFMSRYVFGHSATIDAYLRSLAKRFGESTAEPE
jgi:uncharacterized protein YndB with AHSA1/START domain